jgi:hypothetical protein
VPVQPKEPATPRALPRPARCAITRIGLALLGLSVLCLAVILIAQYFKTGSFARGNGFVLGPHLGVPMLVALGVALLALAVGGVVDSARYGRRSRAPLQHPIAFSPAGSGAPAAGGSCSRCRR